MRKYLFKIFIIICLFSLTSLNFMMVYAEPDANEVASEAPVSEEETPADENTVSEEEPLPEENLEENPDDSDIYTEETESPVAGQQVQTSTVDDSITGIKSVNGLPEANLELNNILNIILIAIGVLLILLAIALLIRIGK